jgi:hypothetical protein
VSASRSVSRGRVAGGEEPRRATDGAWSGEFGRDLLGGDWGNSSPPGMAEARVGRPNRPIGSLRGRFRREPDEAGTARVSARNPSLKACAGADSSLRANWPRPHSLPAGTIPAQLQPCLICCPAETAYCSQHTNAKCHSAHGSFAVFLCTDYSINIRVGMRDDPTAEDAQLGKTEPGSQAASAASHRNLGTIDTVYVHIVFQALTDRPEKQHGQPCNSCSFTLQN